MRSSLSACLRVGKSNSIRGLASVLAFQLASPLLLFSGWSVLTSLAKPFSPRERYFAVPLPLANKLVSEYVGKKLRSGHICWRERMSDILRTPQPPGGR